MTGRDKKGTLRQRSAGKLRPSNATMEGSMRELVVVVALAAVACGSSDGGGGGAVSGTVGGRAFTPTSIKGATAAPTTCPSLPQPLGAAGVSAVALSFDTAGAFCTDLGSLQCPRHQGAQSVTVFVANVAQAPAGSAPVAPAAIGPGTYTVDPNSVVSVLQGIPLVVTSTALAVDSTPACTAAGGTPKAGKQGGTVRIDSIGATQIKGHVDITFCGSDPACADNLKGDFTADLCGTVDICSAAAAQTLCSASPSNVCAP